MDYIQNRLFRAIAKTKKRQSGKYSTIVGYYNVLIQYQLYLMFACVWDKKEPELSRSKRMEYLLAMRRASLGTILSVIVELDSMGTPILGIDKRFQEKVMELISLRNKETAHGILVPGIQEDSYQELASKSERIHKEIMALNIPILSENCKIYYLPSVGSFQATVFEVNDYDYQDLNMQLVKALDLQPRELHYFFGDMCFKLSPFLILREEPNREEPYDIYCYQEYNLKNSKFEYKRYNDLTENYTYSEIRKDYFLSFQEEYTHTISKANGVICNKFDNNYDFFISTSPFDRYEQKVWQFIKTNKSNACLTIRGGGGIGKTALVQYMCTKNIFEPFEVKNIQYVVFCSAKDREFKQSSGLIGHIHLIQDESIVRCYEDIVRTIGWVINDEKDITTEQDIRDVEDELIRTDGVLLIVDDFETLLEEDKKKVVALSSRLDVTKHKMIITTRSQYMVGEEYYLEGLDRFQTISFMRERFRQVCTDTQVKQFDEFVKETDVKNTIYGLTKGLPLLAIQLVNVLVLNEFDKTSLVKREDEEIEDFLLGRLYDYFGTVTSKILFLLVANLFQYRNDKLERAEVQILYSLICEKLHITNIDFEEDLNELKKLNIVLVETDHIRTSNYISNGIIRKCQDKLMSKEDIDISVFDAELFKLVVEHGIKDGILAYCEKREEQVDYAFVKIFVFENVLMYTNDIRFSLMMKYIVGIRNNNDAIRDLYREACKYFEITSIDSKFAMFGRKIGFIIPELADKRDIHLPEEEVSTDYYIQEIITEFTDQVDAIDDFLEMRRKGASQSFCLDTMQEIRGKLGSICNVKLAKLLSLDLTGYESKLRKIKDVMDETSYTKEFNLKESEQYISLVRLVGD